MRNLTTDCMAALSPEGLSEEPGSAAAKCFSPQTALTLLKPLLHYVHRRRYHGFDPFDGLNSRVFQILPFSKSRFFRLALIQFCKQSPINLRPFLLVHPGFNPKGGALFLMGHIHLFRLTGAAFYREEAEFLYRRLKQSAVPYQGAHVWGYNFDWQARAFFVPKGAPNLVTSVYVGRSLLAYYHCFQDREALDLALNISRFILDALIAFERPDTLCFNYIPGKNVEVHNANLLAAAYLAQTLDYFPEAERVGVAEKIMKAVHFSVSDIGEDGAWPYGTKSFHRWADNFHTAYNIECLILISRHLNTDVFMPVLNRVLDYYLAHFFEVDGTPRYYNKKLYPIDIHVLAQIIILLNVLRENPLRDFPARVQQIERRLLALLRAFQDPKGYFYYQKCAYGWNRIPYMRWGQAWMFYALSTCLDGGPHAASDGSANFSETENEPICQ